ncbi:MAG: hypothetical protein ACAH12_09490 [Methylophilaceae bacterium]|uniref:hypothetical protein n=1 Tax=Methylovorus sp. MM2 TaxID=1848038 RepID=UPI0007DF754E|nr:hypothetical protein [Methylovorus sp. MM2]OAM52666.1 hypothetical protein A7981_04210 [Methylovorus sp. MM2]
MAQKNHPDSLVKVLISIFQFGLLLIGLIGLSVEFFKDDGGLRQLLSKMMDSSLGLFWIPIVIAVLYLLNRWLSGKVEGKNTSRGNFPLYAMMAIGAFFVYQLLTTGSF